MKEFFWLGFGAIIAAAVVGMVVLIVLGLKANSDWQTQQTNNRCAEYDKAVAQVAETDPSAAVIFAKDRYYVC